MIYMTALTSILLFLLVWEAINATCILTFTFPLLAHCCTCTCFGSLVEQSGYLAWLTLPAWQCIQEVVCCQIGEVVVCLLCGQSTNRGWGASCSASRKPALKLEMAAKREHICPNEGTCKSPPMNDARAMGAVSKNTK